MDYMKRKLEEAVRAWAQDANSRPLLIQGARRVGKTVLAEHMGRELFEDGFVRLDFQTDLVRASALFDWPTDDVDGLVARIAEYKGAAIRPEKTLIILDEIQLCEQALNSLRFFAGSPWRVLATGSLLGVTTKRRSLPFPSDVVQLELHPLDFEEYLWAFGECVMANDIRAHAVSGEPYVRHDQALDWYRRYLVLGGMPKVLSSYRQDRTFASAAEIQAEINGTYTADMTDPENGISGISAKRIWDSLPKQLLRASTKKFKYAEVVRGGRRERLLEPLEWLAAAGIVSINDLTRDDQAPLAPFNDEEGSYFKVYVADTGIMFFKFGIDAGLFLEKESRLVLASDFRGALAENYVMQALAANEVKTFYWMPSDKVGSGEIDFVFQDRRAQIVPVEVKSARNVKAKSLRKFMEEGSSPYALRLSEANFGVEKIGDSDKLLRSLPLYAAFCITQAGVGA
ncbi:AAA family ATPase [Adlercreutzia sp. R25]|uniref:AAA family ATPase n=1 Tax=Adlercreutzia shanghongiae TaxID=3111773 RepID=A0ABU6J1Z0_9ACTN|nr:MULTISPECIES: AAA family ATPase [unclassified Adlercreutzia]MEC4271612.1 AAA family ATPase [Adlercreutzia sp. R25]MEC4295749.1 AAA family ATPase [Adlercreutzia sp. R22]